MWGLEESSLGAGSAAVIAGGWQPRSLRSIWLSDLHLGTRRCRARELVRFLDSHEAETLYLVGDIVDGWVKGPAWHWNREQGAVVQRIIAWHARGVRIVFLPGNHDEVSIDLAQALLGPIPVFSELLHRTADGRRMLVIHGHQFDRSLNPNRLMYMLGAQVYSRALRIDPSNTEQARKDPHSDSSASFHFKQRLAKAIRYLTDFADRSVMQAARHSRADGIICGHTHFPEERRIGPITYFNDGDWVKSCTALVEEHDGTLRLLYPDTDRLRWSDFTPDAGRAA